MSAADAICHVVPAASQKEEKKSLLKIARGQCIIVMENGLGKQQKTSNGSTVLIENLSG
jgi:hypothetical protein